MQQLLLDLLPLQIPSLENFFFADSQEVRVALIAWSRQSNDDRFLYLWGPTGVGKTHLLNATLTAAAQHGFTTRLLQENLLPDVEADCIAHDTLVAVDQVARLTEEEQIALFYLFNRLKDGGGALLASGSVAPAQLPVRAELATRLSSGVSYAIAPLSDLQTKEALAQQAQRRGFTLSEAVMDYLLRHCPRDFPSLLQLLEMLDQVSLEQQKPVTLAQARRVAAETRHAHQAPPENH